MIYGAVEAGGTKMCCGICTDHGDIIKKISFPTTKPGDTFDSIADFFIGYCKQNNVELDGIGLGWFGPINVDAGSKDYGVIGNTPKDGWKGIDVISEIKKRNICCCDNIQVTTDVNASLLGEFWLGCAKGLTDVCYMTVGTGIGAGIMVNRKLAGGFSHPEFGHILIPRVDGDDFGGICSAHGCCLEGMASGPAMEKRWGVPAFELPDDHMGWNLEADYVASSLMNLILTLCPQKIILGGGVMQHPGMIDRIRSRVEKKLAGYIDLTIPVNDLIELETLNGDQGILGCIKLAMGM